MNNESFDSFIKNHYPKEISNLEISDEARNRIMLLTENSGYGKVSRRILIAQLLLLILLALALPATAYAATKLYSIVSEKVKDTTMTRDEISDLANELESYGFSSKEIGKMTPLQINEYGQSYGPDAFGADLISVMADNGKHGYVYRDELEQDNINTPEEAIKNSHTTTRLKVYKSDGRTIIGYFTMGASNGVEE